MSEVNRRIIWMFEMAERYNLPIFLVIILNIDYFAAWLPKWVFHTGTKLQQLINYNDVEALSTHRVS